MAVVRWARLSTALLLLLAAYALVPTSIEAHPGVLGRLVGLLAVLVASAWVMTRQLRLALHDGDRQIDGLVLAVTVTTLAFALLFYVVELRNPGQVAGLETRLDALYFTVATMLTVGYGDIHAQGQMARALVLAQMVFNVVFVAAAAAMLSSRVRRAADARRPGRE